MSYIGKSPSGSGVRTRYYFTQTSGGGTSISGTDDNGKTLTYTDGEYVDVYLNGVLLVHGTDYGTGTANTISSLAALANGDVVEVVVYDIFNVAKINNEAVRKRYYKTASGSETSISGADDSGATITFPANAEIEVKLNGVALVQGTDYNTTTANTVGGLSALSAGQVVEVVVYERFVLGDTVSKADGGTFGSAVAVNGDLTVDTSTLHVDSTNNQVGVGLTSNLTNSKFQVKVDTDENLYFGHVSSQPYMGFINDAGSSWVTGSIAGNPLILRSGQYATEVARVTTDGITFNGDTAAANALDDYEEGTWTPSVGGTATYGGSNYGRYVKVGKQVHCQFLIDVATIGTGSTTTLSGFPFTSEAIGTVQTGCCSYYANLAQGVSFLGFYIENNATTAKFVGGSGTAAATIPYNVPGIFKNSTAVYGAISYRTE